MRTALLAVLLVAFAASASARTAASECPPMYYKIGNVCGKCPTNALTCTATAQNVITVTACSTGLAVNAAGTGCETDILSNVNAGCAEALCVSSGAAGCALCADGYYALVAGNSTTAYCQMCPGEGVATCSDETTVTACRSGYFLAESGSCTACGTGCARCTSADACDECMTVGYYTDASNACVACADGCVACTADACSECAAQYVLGTDGVCVSKPGCEAGSEGACTTCMDGYRLVSTDGSCKACTSNALTCDSSADGTSQVINMCKENYIKQGSGSTASCKQVGGASIPCIEVDTEATPKCTRCAGAAYVLSAGACVTCASIKTGCGTCTTGTAADAATCSGCATGYHGDGTTCTACAATCAACSDANTCDTCKPGHFKATGDTSGCTACQAGVAAGISECTLYQATACIDGYGLAAVGICRACKPSLNCATCTGAWDVCTACTSPKALNSGMCVDCDTNCATGNTCTTRGAGKCDDGSGNAAAACGTNYSLHKTGANAGTCVLTATLPSNCQTVSTTDAAQCGTCNTSFKLNATTKLCEACPSNCTGCDTSGPSQCDTCASGYKLNATSKLCEACPSNCTGCDTDGPSQCNTCATGYKLNATSKLCEACPSNCTGCDTSGPSQCDTCNATGFKLNATSKLCEACPSNCTGCGTSGPSQCDTCATGYQVIASSKLCAPCSANCTACTTNGGNMCDTCATGYKLNATSKTCEACPANCNACDTDGPSGCNTCATGYQVVAATKLCAACSSNCTSCTTNGGNKCDTCNTGYRLQTSDNTCVACGANCATCNDTSVCESCTSTAFFHDTSDAANKKCTACTDAGCANCSGAAATCTACKTGYYLDTAGACVACPTNCDACSATDLCTTCKAGHFKSNVPTGGATETTYCETCDYSTTKCRTCALDAAGKRTCSACSNTGAYHLTAEGSDKCQNKWCRRSNGTGCTECLYGYKLVDQFSGCVDCVSDKSCPVSTCGSNTPGQQPGTGGNGSNVATDSAANRQVAGLFALVVLAILGLALF